MSRDGDGIDEQCLGLSHLGLVIIARLSSRNADVHTDEVWLDVGRPWIALRIRRQALACRRPCPAFTGNLCKRTRGIAVHYHLDGVKGLKWQAGRVDAGGVVRLVLSSVPA